MNSRITLPFMLIMLMAATIGKAGMAQTLDQRNIPGEPSLSDRDRAAAYCTGVINERMAGMIEVIQHYGQSDVLNKLIAADYARRLQFNQYLQSRGYDEDNPAVSRLETAGKGDMRAYINLAKACHETCPRPPEGASGQPDPAIAACEKACEAKTLADPVAAKIRSCKEVEAALPSPKTGTLPPPADLARPKIE